MRLKFLVTFRILSKALKRLLKGVVHTLRSADSTGRINPLPRTGVNPLIWLFFPTRPVCSDRHPRDVREQRGSNYWRHDYRSPNESDLEHGLWRHYWELEALPALVPDAEPGGLRDDIAFLWIKLRHAYHGCEFRDFSAYRTHLT